MSDQWATPDGSDPAPTGPPAGAPLDGAGSTPPPPPPPPPPPAGLPPPVPPTSPMAAGRDRLLPLRPLAVGEVLDAAFTLVRHNALQLVLLVLSTLGVLVVLQQLLLPAFLVDPTVSATATPEELFADLADPGIWIGLGATFVISLVLTPVVNGAVTWMGVADDRGQEATAGAGLRYGVRRFLPLLGVALLGALLLGFVSAVIVALVAIVVVALAEVSTPLAVLAGLGLGFGALVVIFVAYALLYVAVPALVVEDVGPVTALRRSYRLLRPQLLRTAGIVLLTTVLVAVFSGVAGLATAPLQFIGGRVALLGAGIVQAVVQAVTVPFSAFVALLVYVDARVRQEGLDVAVLTRELGAR